MITNIPDAAIEWLRHGERGISSEAIFSHLTGVPLSRHMWPPADAGDLRRCRALLTQVPEFAARLGEMATVSEQWARLVARWDEVCAVMDREASLPNHHYQYPETYSLIHSVLYVRRAS